MKAIIYNLDFEKEFSFDCYLIIEIENQKLFKNIALNILGQNCEIKDIAIFDDRNQLEIEKDYITIIDYINFEYVSKTALTKLYKNIDSHYKNDFEVAQKINSINRKINDFINNIIGDYDIDFSFDSDFSLEELLKNVSLKPQIEKTFSYQNLINYISFISSLKIYKVIFLFNAQSFFNKTELEEIIKIANYKNIKLVFIENKFNDNFDTHKVQIDCDYFVKYYS